MGTGLKHIRYGNGKWIAVKADGTAFESTDNGQNWQPQQQLEYVLQHIT